MAEIRNNVWLIRELDLIPPESERLESFATLISQVSSRQSHSQVDLSRSCQCCSILTPSSGVVDMQTISGIYKSISVTLSATRIPLTTAFDYATRKTLIGLRKISHNNILRFYGLANLGDKDIRTLFDGTENEVWGVAAEDDFSENRDFALNKTDLPNYYAKRKYQSLFSSLTLLNTYIAMESYTCHNMNGVLRLRWRPPECLYFEVPLVKKLFSPPQYSSNYDNGRNATAEEWEKDGKSTDSEIPLSHFQDPTVDIYSLGVIVNEVWSRAIPYSEIDPEYGDELQLLDAIASGTLKLEISSTMPAILRSMISDCISMVPVNRPSIYSVKRQITDLADTTQTGLDVYLDIMDKKIKDAERRMTNLDEEERCMNAVQEAIFREFLPKPLAERVLLSISQGIDEETTLGHCLPPSRHPQVTVCALRLLNFHESTQTLPLDEVISALNRLNRLMTTIVEDSKVLRISSFGTVMMMAGDPQSADNDTAKQVVSVADCALDLHNCLRCFGKVPRTEVGPEFAIALDTGAVAMVLRPGNAPALCVFGKVMQNARDLLKFANSKRVCISRATKGLLEASGRFKMNLVSSDTEFGEIYSLEKQKK
ncbi:Receptor-type guanylate cyclase gcy-8 [Taenia crassiceps]|uniref:Receptor-type guanylate cyclase gcy-8 n=1 Tax=Taenia crassiceps TaxID=6207 RepID=A0ABR4Q5F4_9CEST